MLRNGLSKMIEGVLKVSPHELNLSSTLACGQCFRWKLRAPKVGNNNVENDDIWVGVIGQMVVELCQNYDNQTIKWKLLNHSFGNNCKRKKIDTHFMNQYLHDYFQLDVCLKDYYTKWSDCDDNFAKKALKLPGIRMLKQDPVENLFSFICSSNNNIPRITGMIDSMCSIYGEQLMIDDEFGSINKFPTINRLAEDNVEATLRKLSFGYRAKFIHQAAKAIIAKDSDQPERWLFELRKNRSYQDAHRELTALYGVGHKVADCVCLMSLDKPEAIPVDTHVWSIALDNYMPHLKKTKNMTDKAYREVGNFFRQLFGPYAGWAHSILFAADLRQFKAKIS